MMWFQQTICSEMMSPLRQNTYLLCGVCAVHLSLIAMHNSRTVLIFRKPKSCVVSVVLLLIGVVRKHAL